MATTLMLQSLCFLTYLIDSVDTEETVPKQAN